MSVSLKAANAALVSFEDAAPPSLRNLTAAAYYQIAVERGEGLIAAEGPLVVKTGEHTGRSAQDKFTVRRPEIDAKIWWDNSKAMTPEAFETLRRDMLDYAAGRELFAQDLRGGADI
ncbi:MAG TPA: hypothetical protein DDZ68_02790, partial [Parvularcula sp.]|nr:hypothetical protein [Parvularcula sp.]